MTKTGVIENTLEWLKHFNLIADSHKPGDDRLLEKSIDLLHILDRAGFDTVKIYRNDENKNALSLDIRHRSSSVLTAITLIHYPYSSCQFECNTDFIDSSMLWDKEEKRAFLRELRKEEINVTSRSMYQ